MALDTYSGLKSTVADYLNREDLTAVLPSFVTLAEAKFNRELRLRDMLVRAEATSSNEYVSLPTDFLQHYSLELSTASAQPPMDYIGPQEAKVLKARHVTVGSSSGSHQQYYYTVIDGAFEIIPAPTADLDLLMVYYAKIPALSDSNTTNWLLTKAPDLYLYSTLLEAAPYLKDDDRVQLWAAARSQVMDAMNLESERAMRSSIQLTARRRGF
jgi:hypothetical protein